VKPPETNTPFLGNSDGDGWGRVERRKSAGMTDGRTASARAPLSHPEHPAPPAYAAPGETAAGETRTEDRAPGASPPPGQPPRLTAGYWVVDPGVAKQSQDWIYAGPAPRRPSPPRRDWWPVALAGAAAAVALLGAAALAGWALAGAAPPGAAGTLEALGATEAMAALRALRAAPQMPWIAGLLGAGALYLLLMVAGLFRRRRAPAARETGAGRANTVVEQTAVEPGGPPGAEPGYDPQASDPGRDGDGAGADGSLDETDLPYDLAAARQAWEGEIETARPQAWPDRPLLVAIGDGVSTALRSAEISRLATRTAWQRTFFHLHALCTGAPPALRAPWAVPPTAWPGPGPARDHLLVQAMSRGFGDANSAVILAGRRFRRENPAERRPTATTLTLLAVDGGRPFLVHVGDCSAYRVHAATGTAEPLQVEHNRAAAYAGHDPARYLEARRQGMQNVLTRWVGMTADWAALDPQVLDAPDPLAPGDALVLCSDGLDKHVTRESIARAALALDARPAATRLVALANDRGGSDHIAVAVLQTGSAPTGPRRRRAMWAEDLRGAWERHRAGATLMLLAGLLAAAAAAGATLVARSMAVATGPAPVPTPQPTPQPTPAPTPLPTPEPSPEPSPEPEPSPAPPPP
jgi:serine/threonine protein phosphatase PrpC